MVKPKTLSLETLCVCVCVCVCACVRACVRVYVNEFEPPILRTPLIKVEFARLDVYIRRPYFINQVLSISYERFIMCMEVYVIY